jgi:hypothetical protein
MSELTEVQHDLLVRQIYDGATEDELGPMLGAWPAVFRSLAAHTMVIDPRGAVIDAAHLGIKGGSSSTSSTGAIRIRAWPCRSRIPVGCSPTSTISTP